MNEEKPMKTTFLWSFSSLPKLSYNPYKGPIYRGIQVKDKVLNHVKTSVKAINKLDLSFKTFWQLSMSVSTKILAEKWVKKVV